VFDNVFYVDGWTARDTEKAVSIFYEGWRRDVFAKMLKRFDLPKDKKVKDLSRGMQMKLMLCLRFFRTTPSCSYFDEPTSGLDPVHATSF